MTDIMELFAKLAREKQAASAITHLIVGLGNPGKEYESTRHNAGFVALDALARKYNISVNSLKWKALVGDGYIGTHRVLLMKPQTYMNLSGEAVRPACDFYKIPLENVIILCDDVSFEPGKLRIRRKGSAGGHNGLKSIIEQLGCPDFPRVKIGVGQKPTPEYDMAAWVLGKLPEADRDKLSECALRVTEAIPDMLEGNIEAAMNKYSK